MRKAKAAKKRSGSQKDNFIVVRLQALAFKKAARAVVGTGRAASRQVLNLFSKKKRADTIMLLTPLLVEPFVFSAASIDGNAMRMLNTVVYPMMTVALLFSSQGVKAPAGRTPWAKLWNALKQPNESTMYFSYAALVPMGALNVASNIAYGLWGGRPEQLGQAALGVLMMSTMGRSLWKRAIASEAAIYPNAVTMDADGPKANLAQKLWKFADDKFVGSRHTGFYLGMGLMGAQVIEGVRLIASHQEQIGKGMLFGLGLQLGAMFAGKLYAERQWDKSLGRPPLLTRTARQIAEWGLAAQLALADDKRPTIRPVSRLVDQDIPTQKLVSFAIA